MATIATLAAAAPAQSARSPLPSHVYVCATLEGGRYRKARHRPVLQPPHMRSCRVQYPDACRGRSGRLALVSGDQVGGGFGVGALEFEDDGGVDVAGGVDGGVAEGFLDFFQVGAAVA